MFYVIIQLKIVNDFFKPLLLFGYEFFSQCRNLFKKVLKITFPRNNLILVV